MNVILAVFLLLGTPNPPDAQDNLWCTNKLITATLTMAAKETGQSSVPPLVVGYNDIICEEKEFMGNVAVGVFLNKKANIFLGNVFHVHYSDETGLVSAVPVYDSAGRWSFKELRDLGLAWCEFIRSVYPEEAAAQRCM